MSYKRKQQEKHRYQHLAKNISTGYPRPVWWDKDKQCWIRYWKSEGKTSCWSLAKKQCRRKARCVMKRTDIYNKKAGGDPWWIVW